MKLRFNRAEMAEAMSAIASVTAHAPKEIHRCVLIEAAPDMMLLSATDLELGLRCAVARVEVEDAREGAALVAADTILRIVEECADETMLLDASADDLHLRGEGSHFKIRTRSAADFPRHPGPPAGPDFALGAADLRRLIGWTAFAAAREKNVRYATDGVLMELSGGELVMAATDGRRLSVGRAPLASSNAESIPKAIVPTRAAELLARLPAHPGAEAMVKVSGGRVLVNIGRSSLSSSLIEGVFPPYRDVIPADCGRSVLLDTLGFLGALSRAALLADESVRLSFTENLLTLSGRAAERGEATISMPIRLRGEAMDIGFNPAFLTDALRAASAYADEVTLAFKDPNHPAMLKLDNSYTHVVMPIRLPA